MIVTLVHGTFSPDAEWTRPGSPFHQELSAGLADLGVLLRRFPWSGANNLFARMTAETELRDDIAEVYSRCPDAQHFIVAHSHGGNIASGLLAGDHQPGISGIVCMATPFFHLRFRDEVLDSRLMTRSWTGILCLLAFVGFIAWRPAWWTELLVIACCAALGTALGYFLGARLSVMATPVRTFVGQNAPCRQIPLLNLRGAGDEAAFALSFGQMIDWLCSAMHRRIVMRSGWPRATILPGRWGAIYRLLLLCAASALLLAFGIMSVHGSLSAGAPWFAAIGTVATVGPVMIKTYWLDNLSLGLASLLLIGSSVFARSWFGTAVPRDQEISAGERWIANLLFPMLLEVRTEAAPPGHWDVTYLPPGPLLPDPIEGRLTHAIYDNLHARELIVRWISDAARAASATGSSTDCA